MAKMNNKPKSSKNNRPNKNNNHKKKGNLISNIPACCNGYKKSYKGYKWEYIYE